MICYSKKLHATNPDNALSQPLVMIAFHVKSKINDFVCLSQRWLHMTVNACGGTFRQNLTLKLQLDIGQLVENLEK